MVYRYVIPANPPTLNDWERMTRMERRTEKQMYERMVWAEVNRNRQNKPVQPIAKSIVFYKPRGFAPSSIHCDRQGWKTNNIWLNTARRVSDLVVWIRRHTSERHSYFMR